MQRRAGTTDASATFSGPEADDDGLRSPFRDLHGPRLHGFALLVALGDRRLAARIAGDALAAGMQREGVLRQRVRKWGVYEDVVLYAVLRAEWSRA
jgi:[ribosomal protein S5]-alanine N-acetyltransferase